jgi:hypothetical protein
MPLKGVRLFTIRELMLVTLVVAIGIGWWLHWKSETVQKNELVRYSQRLRKTLVLSRENIKDIEERHARWQRGETGLYKYREMDWSVLNEPAPTLP